MYQSPNSVLKVEWVDSIPVDNTFPSVLNKLIWEQKEKKKKADSFADLKKANRDSVSKLKLPPTCIYIISRENLETPSCKLLQRF